MFEGEQLTDGIELKVYRYQSPSSLKPVMSFVVRMQGEKVDIGNGVFGPIIEAEKALAKAELEEHIKNKPFFMYKSKILDWQKKGNELTAKVANPLFDYPVFEGQQLVNQWKAEFKAAGLTLVIASRKSNGDLDEEILHWR